jgi:FkbM family methyltransferase
MKKVLFVAPHLSTGGMPQYTYDLMRKIKDDVEVYCVEYSMHSSQFIVQRNRIMELLGHKFYELREDKNKLIDIIKTLKPDIVHLQEVPEYFMSNEVADQLYSTDRDYIIVETSHDSSFPVSSKRYFPDHFALISEYQRKEFSKLNIPIDLVESDIEYKQRQDRTQGLLTLGLDPNLKHVINVGLFTSRKNQAEAIEYARSLQDYPIQFHFVGNQADNFRDYWEPLLKNLPSNVKIWGERSDVDNFYSCMDMMLFTSRGTGNDKETSPLVIRESIGYNLPALIFNLPVYLNMYDKYETIKYMDFDNKDRNLELIKQTLGFLDAPIKFSNEFETLNGVVNFDSLNYPNSMYETMQLYGESAGIWWGTFIYKELDRGNVTIEDGDIFVDLGANIGISSYYASKNGAKKIYCFEPDRHVLNLLEKNIKTNHVSFNYAISNKRDTIELYHWPYNHDSQGPKYTVETITLDDVFKMVGEPIIDYLKMDIEGFEENVFDGTSEDTLSCIRKMFIEHHYPEKTEMLVDKLQKFGFEVYVEYGSGQNYLYCFNNNLKKEKVNPNIDLFSLYFKSEENKIEMNYNGEDGINCKVSIKDADSNVPIYWFQSNFIKNSGYWAIPSPKHIYDFSTDDTFRSFLIEVYDLNGTLLFSKELPIKNGSPKRKVKLDISNPFDCIFFNYNEMFVNGQYDCYGIENLETVFDIGANNGLFSLYLMNRGCKSVYAFEPNKEATKNIKSILGNNSGYELIEKAVSDHDGELTFYVSANNTTIGSISREHVANHSNPIEIKVPCISLKSFINEKKIEKIGLIKMDIEGAEYEIIEDLDEDIFNMTESFLVEFHNNDGKIVDKLIKKITSFGFRLDQIRDQSSSENIDITNSYNNSEVGTIYFTKLPKKVSFKTKAVQFLLNDGMEKQDKSIENISDLKRYGIDYVQHYNDVYVDLPPASKSNRPHDVSMELKPNSLTPAHYGCYDSFRTAVLSEFDSNLDYLLVFEGDAKIQNHEVFINKLNEVFQLMETHNLDYVSFGGIYDLAFGVLQSNVVEEINDDFFVCDKIIGCQCLIFSGKSRDKIKNILRTEKWDALDIYLNIVSPKHGLRVGVSRKTLVTQYDGISTIDNTDKHFKEFDL